MQTAISPSSTEKDYDLFPAFTRPHMLQALPKDSKAFVRVDVSLRAYWHTIFDICPLLLDLAEQDDMAIFRPFMDYVEEKNLSLDWSFYLWIYDMLKQSRFRDRLGDELLLQLMGAAAARWAVLNRGRNCGLVVGCRDISTIVASWKCHQLEAGRQVEQLEVEGLPAPDGLFGCFYLPGFELDVFPGWEDIPR
jgi:uncharacterized repeat protein (TIGR04061 family)